MWKEKLTKFDVYVPKNTPKEKPTKEKTTEEKANYTFSIFTTKALHISLFFSLYIFIP